VYLVNVHFRAIVIQRYDYWFRLFTIIFSYNEATQALSPARSNYLNSDQIIMRNSCSICATDCLWC